MCSSAAAATTTGISACHARIICVSCLLFLLHKLLPSLFDILVSSSPVIACAFLLLGILLIHGESNARQNAREDGGSIQEISKIDLRGALDHAGSCRVGDRQVDADGVDSASVDVDPSSCLEEDDDESDKKCKGSCSDSYSTPPWSDTKSEEEEKDNFQIANVASVLEDQNSAGLAGGVQEEEEEDDDDDDGDAGEEEDDDNEEEEEEDDDEEEEEEEEEYHDVDDETQEEKYNSQVANVAGFAGVVQEEEQEEEYHDAQEEKEDASTTAVKFTTDDQRILMELGRSEHERRRLEHILTWRRERQQEKNNGNNPQQSHGHLPSVHASRRNPSDLPSDSDQPGSAPSVLLPRRNPFDLHYDQEADGDNNSSNWEYVPPSDALVFRRCFTEHARRPSRFKSSLDAAENEMNEQFSETTDSKASKSDPERQHNPEPSPAAIHRSAISDADNGRPNRSCLLRRSGGKRGDQKEEASPSGLGWFAPRTLSAVEENESVTKEISVIEELDVIGDEVRRMREDFGSSGSRVDSSTLSNKKKLLRYNYYSSGDVGSEEEGS